ncbi:hypothetical protein Tco_0313023 [Tanacetum coccineum]
MTTLQFVDTHNLVAFLSKPTKSEGFEQIVNFLIANPIKYALTINPTIYNSCIEQFWAIIKVKTVNGEVQLQALVDGKKIIVTEASVRCDLQLNDEEGMDCLPNATIFEELTRIGYEKLSQKLTFYKAFFSPQWKFLIRTILQCLSSKTTAWNEFSSTMASAIICLATNQKFNFSKYIFESMVKNLDNMGKLFMYPRSRSPNRKDTEVPQPRGPTDNVADEAVYDEIDDSLERAATTTSSLDTKQDRGINLVSTYFDANTDMFGVHDLVGDEVVVESEVTSKDVNLSVDEVTLAQALAALKSAKPKADKVMLQEPEQGKITTTTTDTTIRAASTRPKAKGLVIHEEEQATTLKVSFQQPSQVKVQDTDKGIMVDEPKKPMKKKELIKLDVEIASKLKAEFDKEVRLAREKPKKRRRS